MCAYQGGKHCIRKQIGSIINSIRCAGQPFYEPFCGGCSITTQLDNRGPNFISDINFVLIEMWKKLYYDRWEPPEHITEEEYKECQGYWNKGNYVVKKWPAYLQGFIGIKASYAGRFWAGIGRTHNKLTDNNGYRTKFKTPSGMRSVLKKVSQFPSNLEFNCCSYDKIKLLPNSLVYCDIPYYGTTGYRGTPKFDYELFYQWCERKNRMGHVILMSESYMPLERFKIIWSKSTNTRMHTNGVARAKTENLYTVQSDRGGTWA
jgi:DNA adenine methylase